MNKLSLQKRAQIIGLLVEGNSMCAVTRLVGCSINTVPKLHEDVGAVCAKFQEGAIRNINSKRVQCDEIWSFCYSKEKNVAPEDKGILGHGDAYTWTAIDADTKLAISWFVGRRDKEYAEAFMDDLASRLADRIQLTTDAHEHAAIHSTDKRLQQEDREPISCRGTALHVLQLRTDT